VGATASTELAPVCAIMGGMVAAEVIKIISGKDAPINNLFFLDAATTSGEPHHRPRHAPRTVCTLPLSPPPSRGPLLLSSSLLTFHSSSLLASLLL
jgi:hypothetical protein